MQKVEIFDVIESMSILIRSEQRKRCAELRIQLVHFEVLEYLSHADQYTDTPAATAAYFGMTRGTVSQSIIVLEKKGYIEKNQDETDKRIIHVHILPPGLAILKKVRRKELFTKATSILKKNTPGPKQKLIFSTVLTAIQKASQPHSYKDGNIKNFNIMKKLTVFDIIERMAALIRSEEHRRCTELKVQMVHFQVLDYLSNCNKYSDTPAAIANYLGMTRGTVSQSLIILEKRKLIEKNQDNSDKRVFHIKLLPKGLNILKKAKPTNLYKKAVTTFEKNSLITDGEEVFLDALNALQKANNSFSFGECKTCKNFTRKSTGFFCELTQENLSKRDSEKICQEHIPI